MTRITRSNPLLALAALLGLLGMAGMSAPAAAQAGPPIITTANCRAYFKDLPTSAPVAVSCGSVRVEMMRTVTVRCGGGIPPTCTPNVIDSMRARYTTVPGFSVLSSHAWIMPDACRVPLTTSFGPWCSVPYTWDGYVQMISVLAQAR